MNPCSFVVLVLCALIVNASYAVKDEKFKCYFTDTTSCKNCLSNVVGSGSIVIDSVMPGFCYSDSYKEIRYNEDGINVYGIKSSCSFDPAIKEVVLPDTSIEIQPCAFKTARNIERLILRADYRFKEYYVGSTLDFMFNRAFEGMSSLKELWCDFSAGEDFGVYNHVVFNSGFYGLKYAGAFDYADAVYFPAASSNIWMKLLRNSGYGGHWGCFEGHWPDVKIVAEKDAGNGEAVVKDHVKVTLTNVDVKYVLNSVQPQFAIPATYDTGFVNIIAEVKGGCVAIPATWTVNYPKFTEKFGSDFTKALAMQTGKKDGAGNPMFVWQDYVAGTDPTDETDVFTASITIVDGKVAISYTPELDDARKAMRKYTTWGKEKLTDKDWSVVGEGEEGNFNFFKVTVEMR